MSLKLNLLTAAAAIALASPALAQTSTPPATTTTQTTTTTQPTTTPSGTPATTMQTTTTETQPTTTPDGQPAATTTQTTTTETQVIAATEADVKAGVEVYDQSGALVGKIDKVSSAGAIVNTGKARAEIPLASFGKNDKGLVVSITKAEIEAQAKAKTGKAGKTGKPKN